MKEDESVEVFRVIPAGERLFARMRNHKYANGLRFVDLLPMGIVASGLLSKMGTPHAAIT